MYSTTVVVTKGMTPTNPPSVVVNPVMPAVVGVPLFPMLSALAITSDGIAAEAIWQMG